MKKPVCILLIIALIAAVPAALISLPKGTAYAGSEQLTYYTIKDSAYSFDDIVRLYNGSAKKDFKIKIVEFKDSKELYSRMSTEIMSGGGPDLFCSEHCLPLEKMAEAGAFADIDELLKSNKNSIDLSDLNETVAQAGIIDGKRYILPLFYGLGTSIAVKEVLGRFNLPAKNGYTPTYDKLDILDGFLSDEENCLWSDEAQGKEMFYRFIDSYIDREKKTTDFDTDEFTEAAEALKSLVKRSGEQEFFNNRKSVYFNNSGSVSFNIPLLQNWSSGLIEYSYEAENGIFYRDFSRNAKDNTACVEVGVAVNKNTKQPDKICRFLEFALSNFLQVRVGSDRFTGYVYPSLLDPTFPVRNSCFDICVRYASEYENLYTGESPGIDNEFMREYIKSARNVTKCRLYGSVQNSYYGSNVINEIVDDYLNDEISAEKFIRQLTNATWIYLEE